jgi:hypothetical protein
MNLLSNASRGQIVRYYPQANLAIAKSVTCGVARPDTPEFGYIALQNVIENAIFRAGVNSE